MNIEIHGLSKEHFEQAKMEMLAKVHFHLPPAVIKEARITKSHSSSYGQDGKSKPFFRVYSDNQSHFDLACKVIAQLELPALGDVPLVEFIKLDGCRVVKRQPTPAVEPRH
jgi:hypothetical protein